MGSNWDFSVPKANVKLWWDFVSVMNFWVNPEKHYHLLPLHFWIHGTVAWSKIFEWILEQNYHSFAVGWNLSGIVLFCGLKFVCSFATRCCWVLSCLNFFFGLIILSFSFKLCFGICFLMFKGIKSATTITQIIDKKKKNYTIGIRKIWITLNGWKLRPRIIFLLGHINIIVISF